MPVSVKEVSGTGLAIIVGVVLFVVGLLVVALVGVYGFGWFTDKTANRQGKTSQEQQIQGNGSYRIAAYDHFYDLCGTVQTDKQVLGNTKAELKSATDAGSKLTLNADVLAQANKLDSDVNQYNQDARKSATAGQFRASDLPATLSIKGATSCTA